VAKRVAPVRQQPLPKRVAPVRQQPLPTSSALAARISSIAAGQRDLSIASIDESSTKRDIPITKRDLPSIKRDLPGVNSRGGGGESTQERRGRGVRGRGGPEASTEARSYEGTGEQEWWRVQEGAFRNLDAAWAKPPPPGVLGAPWREREGGREKGTLRAQDAARTKPHTLKTRFVPPTSYATQGVLGAPVAKRGKLQGFLRNQANQQGGWGKKEHGGGGRNALAPGEQQVVERLRKLLVEQLHNERHVLLDHELHDERHVSARTGTARPELKQEQWLQSDKDVSPVSRVWHVSHVVSSTHARGTYGERGADDGGSDEWAHLLHDKDIVKSTRTRGLSDTGLDVMRLYKEGGGEKGVWVTMTAPAVLRTVTGVTPAATRLFGAQTNGGRYMSPGLIKLSY
jgi:hypothetical protein